MKLEETLGLSEIIYAIILSKFEQDLHEAGIVPYPMLNRSKIVTNECAALTINCRYLSQAIEAFKGAIAAYRTLAKKKDAKPLEYFELNELFNFLSYLISLSRIYFLICAEISLRLLAMSPFWLKHLG